MDDWQSCNTSQGSGVYYDDDCRVQEFGNIPIWGVCNYASTLSYYRTTKELCDHPSPWNLPPDSVRAIIKATASLAAGAGFLHGSNTDVGNAVGNHTRDLFGWIIYQSMVKKLNKGNQSIIHDLSYQPRFEFRTFHLIIFHFKPAFQFAEYYKTL